MPAFEINETADPSKQFNGGRFEPHSDQKEFRSCFAVVAGDNHGGWFDAHTVQDGLMTCDGRARLRFEEFKGKTGKCHDVKFNGMTLREFIVPKEMVDQKNAYEAELSNRRVAGFGDRGIEATGDTVGRSSTLESNLIEVPKGHTF